MGSFAVLRQARIYFLLIQHALHFCLELDKACKVRCFCEDFFSLELLILLLVPVLSSVYAESVVFFLFLAVHLICSIYLGEDLLNTLLILFYKPPSSSFPPSVFCVLNLSFFCFPVVYSSYRTLQRPSKYISEVFLCL